MAGHSHWKNIKRKKAVADARRGQAWSKAAEEKLMEIALEAGAEDVVASEDGFEVTTTFQYFEKVRQALAAAKIEMAHAEVMMIPSQQVAAAGENAEKLQKIVDGLEANDDVQNVYTNAELA